LFTLPTLQKIIILVIKQSPLTKKSSSAIYRRYISMDMAVRPVKVDFLLVLPATAQRAVAHEGNIAPRS
jgi:hypothetical protein